MLTTFHFYGSLNDFLPPAQRNQEVAQALPEAAAVKHPIESLGAPHTEVEAFLVNGRSAEFSHRLQDGDRVQVYPQEMVHLLNG